MARIVRRELALGAIDADQAAKSIDSAPKGTETSAAIEDDVASVVNSVQDASRACRGWDKALVSLASFLDNDIKFTTNADFNEVDRLRRAADQEMDVAGRHLDEAKRLRLRLYRKLTWMEAFDAPKDSLSSVRAAVEAAFRDYGLERARLTAWRQKLFADIVDRCEKQSSP